MGPSDARGPSTRLEPGVSPVSGLETVVFSCFNQDQALDDVDFTSLRRRLGQNGVQEKVTELWIDHCLRQVGLRQVAAAE